MFEQIIDRLKSMFTSLTGEEQPQCGAVPPGFFPSSPALDQSGASLPEHQMPQDVREWLDDLKGRSTGMERPQILEEVNRYVNNHVGNITEPPGVDRWTSPAETLADGGDCEDKVLLKAALLQHLGFSKEQMFLEGGKGGSMLPGFQSPTDGHVNLLVKENGTLYGLDTIKNSLLDVDRLKDYIRDVQVVTDVDVRHVCTLPLPERGSRER